MSKSRKTMWTKHPKPRNQPKFVSKAILVTEPYPFSNSLMDAAEKSMASFIRPDQTNEA